MRKIKALKWALLLVIMFAAGVTYGTVANTETNHSLIINGGKERINIGWCVNSTFGGAAVKAGVDSDVSQNKHSWVFTHPVTNPTTLNTAGNALATNTNYMLVRAQESNGTLFIDLIDEASLTSLVTTVNAFNITNAGVGHPSPQKDFIDAQAMVNAGGS